MPEDEPGVTIVVVGSVCAVAAVVDDDADDCCPVRMDTMRTWLITGGARLPPAAVQTFMRFMLLAGQYCHPSVGRV